MSNMPISPSNYGLNPALDSLKSDLQNMQASSQQDFRSAANYAAQQADGVPNKASQADRQAASAVTNNTALERHAAEQLHTLATELADGQITDPSIKQDIAYYSAQLRQISDGNATAARAVSNQIGTSALKTSSLEAAAYNQAGTEGIAANQSLSAYDQANLPAYTPMDRTSTDQDLSQLAIKLGDSQAAAANGSPSQESAALHQFASTRSSLEHLRQQLVTQGGLDAQRATLGPGQAHDQAQGELKWAEADIAKINQLLGDTSVSEQGAKVIAGTQPRPTANIVGAQVPKASV